MLAVPYESAAHRSMLKHWLLGWKLPLGMLDLLPHHGVIVPDFAVGFVYCTDSKIAYGDGFIANPQVSREQRNDALDAVLDGLVETARHLGYHYLWGYTAHPGVAERGRRHGGVASDEKFTFSSKYLLENLS